MKLMIVGGVEAAPADQCPFLLDVRTALEFSAGSIPGAVNISVDELRVQKMSLKKNLNGQ